MRKRYLIPALALCLLAACAAGCSADQGPEDTTDGGGQTQDVVTTTTLPPTTTTLAPAVWEKVVPDGDVPSARLGSSLVYVSAGDKLLLFGGWDGASHVLKRSVGLRPGD